MNKLSIIISIFLMITSCQKEEQYQYANLDFKLVATTTNYEKVLFDIESLKVFFETPTKTGQWIEINKLQKDIYNLTDYINGNNVLIASTTIAQGTIKQINIGFGKNNSVSNNEGTFDLVLPAAVEASGITINLNEEIDYAQNKTLYLDFDLSKSITKIGTGNFQALPEVRSYAADNTGGIEGMISPIESRPVLSVNQGTDVFNTTINNDGYFCIQGLNEGIYELSISPSDLFLEQKIQNIKVLPASNSNIGNIVIESNEQIATTVYGDLNINPSTSEAEYFILQTPSKLIDINLLQTEGDLFTYVGSTTSIKIMPKAQGATISIDNTDIVLDKNTRYTLVSRDTPLNVNLRNVKGGNGNWWIEISGNNISISPKPNNVK